MITIVSNNPFVKKHRDDIDYLANQDYLDVLIRVRDLIHQNYHLVTHPLSSNFLADKTCYKTVVLKPGPTVDLQSIDIIERAIVMVKKSLVSRSDAIYNDSILKDLQKVDYEIIKHTL